MMITNPDVEAVWKFSEGHGLHVTCRWLAAYRRIRLSLLVADSRRYERVGGPCVAQKVRDVAGGAMDVVVCFHLSRLCHLLRPSAFLRPFLLGRTWDFPLELSPTVLGPMNGQGAALRWRVSSKQKQYSHPNE